jgi:GTPase SAR1 family protein
MAEGSNYDYLFKVRTRSALLAAASRRPIAPRADIQVVLIGDSGVGKS